MSALVDALAAQVARHRDILDHTSIALSHLEAVDVPAVLRTATGHRLSKGAEQVRGVICELLQPGVVGGEALIVAKSKNRQFLISGVYGPLGDDKLLLSADVTDVATGKVLKSVSKETAAAAAAIDAALVALGHECALFADNWLAQ